MWSYLKLTTLAIVPVQNIELMQEKFTNKTKE